MLETERYQEAVELLTFLLHCRTDDPQTTEEWQSLLGWLKTSLATDTVEVEADTEDDVEWTEQDLHKQRFYSKMSNDPNYVKKLLETLLNEPKLDHKMNALEQLSVADHPQIDETLKRWLEQVDLHPIIQFKVLQTLKARSATGTLQLQRCGEQVQLQITDTPMDINEYPEGIQAVLRKIRATTEIDQPNLVYFVEHTWKEFLSYIYGTSIYQPMCTMKERSIRIWSSALHQAILETMSTSFDLENLDELYKLEEQDDTERDEAYELIKSFISSVFIS
jgi:hypothetical protein